MDKELKRIIEESLNDTFKSGIPISGEEKYLKQQPGGTFGTSNVDGIMQELQTIDEESFRVYNDTLCPALWNQSLQLDPEVRSGLLKVAEDFYEKSGLKSPIIDVYLMGSIANYNWTLDSDVDVHIIIDYNQLQIPLETTKEVVHTIASQWNNEHEVTVKGHKVEINFQNVREQKPHVTGIYSLKFGKWIRQPVHKNVQINKMLVQTKFKAMKKYVEAVISSGDREIMKQAKKYIDAFRQYGLDTVGEMSIENIVFKALRAKGLLTQLKDSIVQVYDKEMTVKEGSGKDGNTIEKDLRARHPNNPDFYDRGKHDWPFQNLTLDNLKALKDKTIRTYNWYKIKSNREKLTDDEKRMLSNELVFLNQVNVEIKRRLNYINKPVEESGHYMDYGHEDDGNWIWQYFSDGTFRKEQVDVGDTHVIVFPNRGADFEGRYDVRRRVITIADMSHLMTPSQDVDELPTNLIRRLKFEFGDDARIKRFYEECKEGYGAGIPETDRLKINNTDGSVKRWQIRSKDAPKTPKIKEEDNEILTESPEMKTLKKNKKPLTDDERKLVMSNDAVWHHGPKGEETPAVWKSVINGKTWYVTNTHRAYQAKPTIKGAIKAYHDFIKSTA